MVTDLRRALREAVESPPADDLDLTALVTAGAGRVRRRRLVAGAGVGLVAAAAAALVALPDRPEADTPIRPAAPVQLDLDTARPADADIVATARTLWLDPANELDFDNLIGITDDGLVARSRYTYEGDVSELGLLDPATGRTDWLPRPPYDLGEPAAFDLGTDRLVYLDNRQDATIGVVVFDRDSRTWSRSLIRKPAEGERFFGQRPTLGPDGRIYLLDGGLDLEWWSVPLTGGDPRREPALDGHLVAWSGDVRATADRDGRVVLTRGGDQQVISEGLPAGCSPLSDPDGLPTSPPIVTFAGTRPVVTFPCDEGPLMVVYGADGEPELAVPGAAAASKASSRYVIAVGDGRTLAVDVVQQRLLDLGTKPHEGRLAAVGDLVLWDEVGPRDGPHIYDVVDRAARLR